jgi:hypothetical protein
LVESLITERKEAEMKRAFSMLLMIFLLLVPMSLHTGSPTLKASETVISRVIPENVTVKLGQPFSVNVTFDDLPYSEYNGVAGCEFNITWNASVLQIVSMKEIAFHVATPQVEWDNIWRLDHVISSGSLLYVYTWKDLQRAESQGYCPLMGNGTWALITFVSLAPGETVLDFSRLKMGSLTEMIQGSGIDGRVYVTSILAGDINQDGIVDSGDLILLSVAFGSYPYAVHWNPDSDINTDDVVDIYDALILAGHYNEHYP